MFKKGQDINPKELETLIHTKFKDLISLISKYIPLGFNETFSITGYKTFLTRPKVTNPTYSTVSKGDTIQPAIGAAFLGTPYTLELGQNLGLANYQTFNFGSKDEPFFRANNNFLYNPNSDLVGGVPIKGNSPLLFNGFVGFNNFFEDSNIRTYSNEDGTELTIKAKRISLMIRPQNLNDFTVTNDSIKNYTDRFNMELKSFNDINITMNVNTPFAPTVSNGYYPANTTGDQAIWLVFDPSKSSVEAIRVPWNFDYVKVLGVINNPYNQGGNSFLADYPSYKYVRCVACVHVNDYSNTFDVSRTLAWGETATGSNGNYGYTELYQQDSSPDTTIRLTTQTNDRRIKPAFYYLDQKNDVLINKTFYNGITRNLPGAGASKVFVQWKQEDGFARDLSIKVGSCELTNGTQSIWLKDISFPSLRLETTANLEYDGGGASFPSSNTGFYIWLTANPKSILDTSVYAGNNNLRIKLVASQSATWDASNGNSGVSPIWKLPNAQYAYRARIAWVPDLGNNWGYTMINGKYTFNQFPTYISWNQNGDVIGTGNTTGGTYTALNLTNVNIPRCSIGGTRFEASQLGVRLVIDDTTANTTSEYVALTTTTLNSVASFGTLGKPSSFLNERQMKITKTSGTSIKYSNFNDTILPIMPTDTVYYAGTNLQGTSGAYVNSFYLPIGSF